MLTAIIAGFLTSLSLILAIGAQNAFVLRQGLRREHILPIVILCASSDAALIAIGVGGFTMLGPHLPLLSDIMRWTGVVFLLVYGGMRFHAAWQGAETLLPSQSKSLSLTKALLTCFIITWVNPHVYLDTVMLLGSISSQYRPNESAFGLGAMIGSFVFFLTLGYGARWLAPVLANVRAWIVLEILIGITMWGIAAGLIFKTL